MSNAPLKIEGKVFLAPMAGFCDATFRQIADEFGADATVSEMVSARALNYGDKKSRQLMLTNPHKGLYGIQLFGFDPADFDRAVKIALEYGPDFIDINMGCPAPKITGNGSGSALMKNLPLAGEIVKTTVKAAGNTPVSVKMRTGWDSENITCIELARICEDAGAAFITVHGRTRQQMYYPGINPRHIRRVKRAVNIPVVANGDITSGAHRLQLIRETSANRVMVGRAALGNPWIFGRTKRALDNKDLPQAPTVRERVRLFLRHMNDLCQAYGEQAGMKKARGHAPYYMKGLRGAAKLRGMTNTLSTYADRENLARRILEENPE